MSKMVQIRDVPENLHRLWRLRAAAQGRSLSDYLLSELRHISATPTMEEWLQLVRSRPPLATGVDLAAQVRAERASR